MPILGLVAILIQIIDKSLGDGWMLSFAERASSGNLTYFSGLVALTLLTQFLLLHLGKKSDPGTVNSGIITKFVGIGSRSLIYLIMVIITSILFQLIAGTGYSLFLLVIIVTLTEMYALVILGLLSYRLAKSYIYSKSMIACLYSIAMGTLAFNAVFSWFYITTAFDFKPEYITPFRSPWGSYYTPFPLELVTISNAVNIVSFILPWLATAVLLLHYSHKIGRSKYWLILCIPLVYFTSQFLMFLPELLEEFRSHHPAFFKTTYNFIVNSVQATGGILFGFAFVILARSIGHTQLKKNLLVAGTGMMLVISSSIPTILMIAPYPPIGIVSISFLVLGSYLLFMGLESSSMYIASDSVFRRTLKESSRNDKELLRALGSARVEEVVARRVTEITRRVHNELEDRKLITPDLTEEELRNYMQEVLMETKRQDAQFKPNIREKESSD